jgi:prolyl 4-hydroxylase
MTGQRITESLQPALSEWFDLNCSMGCSPEQLKAALLGAGYRDDEVARFLIAQFARQAAAQVGGQYDAEPVSDASEAVQRFWKRLELLGNFNRISLGERTVRILVHDVCHGICFIPDFLSHEECQGLIQQAGPLSQSKTVDERNDQSISTAGRSSHGTSVVRGANALVNRVERRIARLSGLAVAHGEALQLLHYGVGGEYRPHVDYFDPTSAGGKRQLFSGSQRLATIIMYLCDVESGGATAFPELSLAFTPLQGAALVFASLGRDGQLLPTSLHGGCPVTSGEKWIATKWLRLTAQPPDPLPGCRHDAAGAKVQVQ